MIDAVSLDPVALRALAGAGAAPEAGVAPAGSGRSFATVLEDLVQEADGFQHRAAATVDDFVDGKAESVHEVMIALNRADLSFRMMLEVRNKLLEAYQEVMRTPV